MNLKPKKYRIFLFAYLILIVIISSIPGHNFPKSELFSYDKLLHVTEYSLVGFLALGAFGRNRISRIVIILLACACFAAADEFWQSLIPGRNSDMMDFFADNIGIWIGAGFSISLNFFKGDD